MEEKYVLEIDRYERGITLNALNHLRNKLLEDGIDTDTVDDLILKKIEIKKKEIEIKKYIHLKLLRNIRILFQQVQNLIN